MLDSVITEEKIGLHTVEWLVLLCKWHNFNKILMHAKSSNQGCTHIMSGLQLCGPPIVCSQCKGTVIVTNVPMVVHTWSTLQSVASLLC